MNETPRRIWLQVEEDGEPTDEITWCADNVNTSDVEYTRSDIVADLLAACKTLEKAEVHYRLIHDVHGGGSPESGRAWDKLRRYGDKARAAIAKAEATP